MLDWLSNNWWMLGAVAAGLLVIGGIAGFALGLALEERRPVPRTPHSSPPAGSPAEAPATALVSATSPWPRASGDQDTQQALVLGLIAVHDLATDRDGIRTKVEQVLRMVGIKPVYPQTGERFDPDTHEAVSTEPVPPGASPETIARVVRPGWRGDAVDYRPTEVTVWTT